MAKQILNRREPIYADEIPAEIADTSGFVTATDYATDTTGGTVKVDDAYGVELTQAGKLRGTVETAAAYAEAGNNLLVSKGTLDAVLAAQPGGGGAVQVYSGEPVTIATNAEIPLSEDVSTKAFLVFVINISEGRFSTAVASYAGTNIGAESTDQVNSPYLGGSGGDSKVLYTRLSANNKVKFTYAASSPGSVIAIFAV